MSRATLRDVALRANVGIAGISRVLNDGSSVRDATRHDRRVAIKELDDSSHPAALCVSSCRTGMIVRMHFLTRPSTVERLRGVQCTLADREYDLVRLSLEAPDPERAQRTQDGETVTVPVDAEHLKFYGLVFEAVRGGFMATGYLIDLGHRMIADLSDLLRNPINFVSIRPRFHGQRRANKHEGVSRPGDVYV